MLEYVLIFAASFAASYVVTTLAIKASRRSYF